MDGSTLAYARFMGADWRMRVEALSHILPKANHRKGWFWNIGILVNITTSTMTITNYECYKTGMMYKTGIKSPDGKCAEGEEGGMGGMKPKARFP